MSLRDRIVEQLRRAVRGEVPVTLAPGSPHTWDESYCGDVTFRVGDWTMTFFNDCDEVDYLDSAVSPDGEEWKYDWVGDGYQPLDELSHAEIEGADGLERWLKAAVRP